MVGKWRYVALKNPNETERVIMMIGVLRGGSSREASDGGVGQCCLYESGWPTI